MTPVDVFAAHFQLPGVDAETLALDIARIAYPGLAAEPYLDTLDELARLMARHVTHSPAAAASPAVRASWSAHRFLAVFNEDLRFRGDTRSYYAPQNSLMSDVLERRCGLPIMLCVVCGALGRRLGLPVEGMAFPGHFMARLPDERGAWLLDPFHGVVLAPTDAAAYLSRIVGRPVHLTSSDVAPAGAQSIALRILNNLRNAYVRADDITHLRRVLDFQVAVLPQEPELWRERALLQFRLAEYEGASYSVRRYFAVTGRLAVLLESVRPADQPALAEQERQLFELYRRANVALARIN